MQEVSGSIPLGSTNFLKKPPSLGGFFYGPHTDSRIGAVA